MEDFTSIESSEALRRRIARQQSEFRREYDDLYDDIYALDNYKNHDAREEVVSGWIDTSARLFLVASILAASRNVNLPTLTQAQANEGADGRLDSLRDVLFSSHRESLAIAESNAFSSVLTRKAIRHTKPEARWLANQVGELDERELRRASDIRHRKRSNRISQNEVASSWAIGSEMTFVEALNADVLDGGTMTWNVNDEDRACPVCSPLDGLTINAGEQFPLGLPTLHIKCLCWITYSGNRR